MNLKKIFYPLLNPPPFQGGGQVGVNRAIPNSPTPPKWLRRLDKFQSGQIMLETVIALGVITVGIYAAFTLSVANINQSELAVNRFISSQLAREGVEIVRSIRDTTWLLPEPDLNSALLNTLSNRILQGVVDQNNKLLSGPIYAVPFWNQFSDFTECPAMDAWCLKFLAPSSLPTPPENIEKQLGLDLTPIDNRTQICSKDISTKNIYSGPALAETECPAGSALPYRRLLKFKPICGVDGAGQAIIACTGQPAENLIGLQVVSFVSVPSRQGVFVYSTPASLYEWR